MKQMKMRGMRIRRAGALVLAGIMAVSLTACGGKKEGGGTTAQGGKTATTADLHVYASQALDATGLHLENVSRFFREDERIYGIGNGPVEDGTWRTYLVSFVFRDGTISDAVKYILPSVENGDVSQGCMDEEGNLYAFLRTFEPMTVAFEEIPGDMEVTEEATDETTDEVTEEATDETTDEAPEEGVDSAMAESEGPKELIPFRGETRMLPAPEEIKADGTAYLLKYDAAGTLLYATPIDASVTRDEYFYVNSMVATPDAVLFSSSGNIAMCNASDGAFKGMVVEGGENGWLYLCKLKDGRVIMNGWGSEGQVLQEIDVAAGKPGTSHKVMHSMNPDAVTAGDSHDLSWIDASGVFAMNLGDEQGEEILNFVDSDLGGMSLDGFVVLEGGQILANLNSHAEAYETAYAGGYSEGEGGRELTLLTPVPASEIGEKEIITLGCLYSDSHIASEVVKFNKNSRDYRIRIQTYMNSVSGSDYETAMETFNTHIVTGNMPDIVIVDPAMSLERYYSKGVFEPLDEYLENDEELKNADFMDNILEAMKHEGKTYLMSPGFSAITLTAKTSHVKDFASWNADAFEAAIEKSGVPYETAFGFNVDASTILQYFVLFNSNNFIDYHTHKCDFNSPDFIRLLQMTKKFPAPRNEEGGNYEYDDTAWREDRALFDLSAIGDFDSYWRMRYLVFGEEVSFIGFPTESGENGSSFLPDTAVAMSAAGAHKDACWEFMRRLYLEEYQDGMEWSLPVRISSLEKKAKKATEPEMWLNPETGKMEEQESYWGLGDTSVKKTPLTQEDVDFVIDFLKTLNVSASFNEQIAEIIQEEAAPFFSGQKSAEEVAGIIQSRVQVYLNENS